MYPKVSQMLPYRVAIIRLAKSVWLKCDDGSYMNVTDLTDLELREVQRLLQCVVLTMRVESLPEPVRIRPRLSIPDAFARDAAIEAFGKNAVYGTGLAPRSGWSPHRD